ncbi:MAG TPA: hypothetical protein VF255_00560 [Solirubrobacterales bacterium]
MTPLAEADECFISNAPMRFVEREYVDFPVVEKLLYQHFASTPEPPDCNHRGLEQGGRADR